MQSENQLNQPKYRISIVAELLNIHPQTIRTYEKLGLIEPQRSSGNTRLFSDKDLERIKKIQTLTRDLGVNLAGVEIVLRHLKQMEMMNQEAQTVFTSLMKLLNLQGKNFDLEIEKIVSQCEFLSIKNIESGT